MWYISLIAFCVWYRALTALILEHSRSQIIITPPVSYRPSTKAMAKPKSKPIYQRDTEHHFVCTSPYTSFLQLIKPSNSSDLSNSALCRIHCTLRGSWSGSAAPFLIAFPQRGVWGSPGGAFQRPLRLHSEEGCFALHCLASAAGITRKKQQTSWTSTPLFLLGFSQLPAKPLTSIPALLSAAYAWQI